MYSMIKLKRLAVDLPIELHNEIKAQAAYRNASIRKYVIAAIVEKIKQDKAAQ